MRLGFEIELPLGSLGVSDDVGGFIRADRHILVRQVWDVEHEVLKLSVRLPDLRVQLRDLVAQALHLSDQTLPFFRVLRLADQLRACVALGLDALDLGDHAPAALIELEDPIDRNIDALGGDASAEFVWVLSNNLDIQHRRCLSS